MKINFMLKYCLLILISVFLLSCDSNSSKCSDNPCADSPIANKTVCKEKGSDDFTCVCESGYIEEAGLCKKDFCASNPCTEVEFKTVCENSSTGFTCKCDDDHELKDGICKQRGANSCYPINPCKDIDNSSCAVIGPSDEDFSCDCDTGFHKNPEGKCVKTVDPCLNEPCSDNTATHKTKCKANTQTEGDYTCVCKSGYQLVNDACEEVEMSAGCNMPRYQEIFENDLRDLALLNKLNQITGENYHSLGYTGAKHELYNNIDKIDGQNQCAYTGVWYDAGSGVNCEHTWPQSQFGRTQPMKSDLHHLFPTNSRVNSSRGHLRFGNVSEHIDDYDDYDDYGECNMSSEDYYCSKRLLSGGDNGIFEPADQHKGNVARAIFYFATRYGNMSGEINGVVAPFIDLDSKMALKGWNKLDPVDQNERNRNDRIEGWIDADDGSRTFSKLQGNRNPYIDCPELLDRIDLDNLDFPEEY